MLRWLSLACAPVLAAACSTSEDTAAPTEVLREGGAARDADATPQDAATDPKPLPALQPLVCNAEPCFTQVSANGPTTANEYNACSATTLGKVFCWGNTLTGALGRGGAAASREEAATPRQVIGLPEIDQIVATPDTACARSRDGDLYCWGKRNWGEPGLTDYEETTVFTPRKLPGLPPVADFSIDGSLGCAVARGSGEVFCWGLNHEVLGPSAVALRVPSRLAGQVRPVKAVRVNSPLRWYFSGYPGSITLLYESGVVGSVGPCPGRPSSFNDGQLADWSGIGQPRLLGDGPSLISGGNVYAWGELVPISILANRRKCAYELRGGFAANELAYVARYVGATPNDAVDYGIDAKGIATVTGKNTAGQLGALPEALEETKMPLPVTLPMGARSLAYLGRAFCASLVDGRLMCWGANDNGQLGQGAWDLDSHPVPREVAK